MKVATVREIGTTLPKETNRLEIKTPGRRMKHQRSTLASFAMGFIEFSSV